MAKIISDDGVTFGSFVSIAIPIIGELATIGSAATLVDISFVGAVGRSLVDNGVGGAVVPLPGLVVGDSLRRVSFQRPKGVLLLPRRAGSWIVAFGKLPR